MDEHFEFIGRCVADGSISLKTGFEAWVVYRTVSLKTEGLMPIPGACSGPDGRMHYSWNHDHHHLSVDFIPGEPAEWFYHNRLTEETWLEEHDSFLPLTPVIIGKLILVCQPHPFWTPSP